MDTRKRPQMSRKTRSLITIAAVGALLTGCATTTASSTGASSPTDASSTEKLVAEFDKAYDGPDAGNFLPLPDPKIVDGTSFSVGFLTLNGSIGSMKAVEDTAREEVLRLGGTFESKDAQVNPQTQVTQFDEFIASGVDIIIGYPVVEAALAPSIARAAEKGIPFVAVGTPVDSSKPAVGGTVSSVHQGYDYIVWKTMQEASKKWPGGNFGVVGTALPIDALKYMTSRMEFWGKEFGMNYVATSESQQDTPAGHTTAAQALLTQHPDLDVIVGYDDQVTLSIAGAIASSSTPDVAAITPNAGTTLIRDALLANRVDLAYRVPWESMGLTAARMAYSVVTDQGTPLPRVINVPGYLTTPETAKQSTWIGE
jgi:ribose transport system substrate-binding protein